MASEPAAAAQQPGDALWPAEWAAAAGERTIAARELTESPEVTLYSSWFCPYAQRAWIAAEERQIRYRWEEINPYEVDPSRPGGYSKTPLPLAEKRRLRPRFVEASPRGLVPALRHGGTLVHDSLAVVQYLDEAFPDAPGPALLPADAGERARVRIWTAHGEERVQRAYYRMLMAQARAEQAAHREAFFAECRALARAMGVDGDGCFLGGDRFSLFDVALAPFWQRILLVGGHYRGLALPDDEPEFARLARWWAAVRARPSVAATLVCEERLIASYWQYSVGKGKSDFALGLSGGSPPRRGLGLGLLCLVGGVVGFAAGRLTR